MNIVLDSNIYIAAFASHGLCHALMELCIDTHALFVSNEILSEVQKGLEKKIKLPPRLITEIIFFLKQSTTPMIPEKLKKSLCRDPNDDHVLGLCLAAKAKYIVTGDNDLLDLRNFDGVSILKPRQFWEVLRTDGERC